MLLTLPSEAGLPSPLATCFFLFYNISMYKKSYRFRFRFITEKKNTCENCGLYHFSDSFFDIDHVKPQIGRYRGKDRKRGFRIRESDRDNLRVLCPNCHRLKTLKDRGII